MTKQISVYTIFVTIPVIALTIVVATAVFALDYHSDCSFCHVLHSAPGSYLVNNVNSETVCMSCHDGSVTGAPEVTIHESRTSEFYASCVDCHDTHSDKENYEGGTNISMVGFSTALAVDSYAKIISNYDDEGTVFNVVFDSSREFWNGGGPRTIINSDTEDERKVCEVCHEVPIFGGMRTHPFNDNCTANCHKHSNGFMRITGP